MNRLKLLFWFILLLRLIVGALIPIAPDEAYYWAWAQKIDIGYFDHPPMVAWLHWVGQNVFNGVFFNRLAFILVSQVTLFICIRLMKDFLDEKEMFFWVLLMGLNPLTGLGGIVATPDVPLLFFWTLSLIYFWRANQSSRPSDWILLGLSLGCGFISKYHMVIFVFAAIAFLASQGQLSKSLNKKIGFTFAAGLIASSPVLVWNYQNEFISFVFQIQHGLGKPWTLAHLPEYVLGQFLILSPIVVWILLKILYKKDFQGKSAFFLIMGGVPLLFFAFTSLRGRVEANWPLVSMPFLLALAAKGASKEIKQYLIGYWVVIYSLIIGLLWWQPLPEIKSKISDFTNRKIFASLQKQYKNLFFDRYQSAALAWFENQSPAFKLNGINRFDMFDLWGEGQPSSDHFYLLRNKNTALPEWVDKQGFKVKSVLIVEPDLELEEMRK